LRFGVDPEHPGESEYHLYMWPHDPGKTMGYKFQSGAEGGDGDKISVYIKSDFSAVCQAAVYNSDGSSIITNGTTNTAVAGGTYSWVDHSFGAAPEIVATTDYVLASAAPYKASSPYSMYWKYDTGDEGDSYNHSDSFLPEPLNASGDKLFSIYCTYTPAAAGTNMKINIGDTWKDVDSMKINIGDTWKDVSEVKQNIGDTWKTVF